jgi:hypothetical protein
MPQYVSDGGVWHPAKEHAVLPHLAGTEKEIYDGPDRAAMEELAKAYGVDEKGYPKQGTFGMLFEHDPDLIHRAKTLGFANVKEYADASGYDPIKAKEDFEKKASKIEKYELPKRQPERQIDGGGKDLSGQGKDKYGGLGDPPELK